MIRREVRTLDSSTPETGSSENSSSSESPGPSNTATSSKRPADDQDKPQTTKRQKLSDNRCKYLQFNFDLDEIAFRLEETKNR